MESFESLKCLACLDQIPEGQDIAIPLDFQEPGETEQQMIAYICWYCSNDLSVSPARRAAIEAVINARIIRLKYDEEKSYKP